MPDLRQRKGRPYTYVILLTARGRKEDIVEGLEAGADDYVTKPFDPYELRARLRAGRRIVELQEQLLQAREALRDQASRDPLTGLWNHGTILAILRKEVGARLTHSRSLRRCHGRRGQVQNHQRYLRPPRGRRGAAGGGAPPSQRHAHLRFPGPLWRR